MVTPDNKRTMAESTASWSETAQELKEDDNLKLELLIHKFTFSSIKDKKDTKPSVYGSICFNV